MGPWGQALDKMQNPNPTAPSASTPGMGAGGVPYAQGLMDGNAQRPARPDPVPAPSAYPAPGGAPQGPAPSGPAGAPPGPGGMPMGANPFQMQAEILSTLMSAVMASIERAKQRRQGTYPGSGY